MLLVFQNILVYLTEEFESPSIWLILLPHMDCSFWFSIFVWQRDVRSVSGCLLMTTLGGGRCYSLAADFRQQPIALEY